MNDAEELKDIRVTFRNNETDRKLRKEITEASKIIGPGTWMKQAAYEKLERDKLLINQSNNRVSKSNSTINSLGDLFK